MSNNLKLRIVWEEVSFEESDFLERAVVSDQYYPAERFFNKNFIEAVDSWADKANLKLEKGTSDVFYNLHVVDFDHEEDIQESVFYMLDSLVSTLETLAK